MEINHAYLSLGSNMDDPLANLKAAITALEEDSKIKTDQISFFYESTAWGYTSENKYINCCIHIKTELDPFELLKYTQEIEKKLGRTIKNSYADRKIDIDIIFFNDLIINNHNLQIPHQHWTSRDFVLYPLLDILDEIKIEENTISIFETKLNLNSTISTDGNQIIQLK